MKITRDELLIAAFKLFMSVNYEKASFAELGKILGMSKAGIFKYYKNKQELFIAVVDKFWFSTQNPRNKLIETNGTKVVIQNQLTRNKKSYNTLIL